MKGSRTVVLDIETGGFSKTKNAICSIGILVLDDNFEVKEEFYTLVSPYLRRPEIAEEEGQLCSYKDSAMEVHKIPMDEILKAPSAEEVGALIFDLLINNDINTIMGFCSDIFDKPWIEEFFDRFGGKFKFDVSIDVMKMAMSKGHKKHSLEALCEHYKIVNEDAHNALSDCKATLKLFHALMPEN